MSRTLVEQGAVRRVAIVGAGLMGGSLALAIRPYFDHLAIIEPNPHTHQAIAGLADHVTNDLALGIADVDLVILAAPVRAILQILADLPRARPDGCLLLDLGSTKMAICQAMSEMPPSFQALGGHPLCGKETAGFNAADPDLYRNQTFVLCRNHCTTSTVEQATLAILERIGSHPIFLPPDVHDGLVGITSHLPYLASAALVRTAAALPDGPVWQISASGFRDVSRLSGSDPTMMLDILLTNRQAILAHLQNYQETLTAVQNLLQIGDEKALANWLLETQSHYHKYQKKSESRLP